MNKRSKSISFGDKIFARVTLNGRTVYNFVSEKVANMADLIGQIRFAMKEFHGLVMLHIRNYHQGWGEERPLMLYAEKTPSFTFSDVARTQRPEAKMTRRMYFPWETH